jgi:hypothetical protein
MLTAKTNAYSGFKDIAAESERFIIVFFSVSGFDGTTNERFGHVVVILAVNEHL